MAKPKSEQQPTSAPDPGGAVTVVVQAGDAVVTGGGGGGPSSEMPSARGVGAAPEGAPAGTGAGTDSPAPGTVSPDGAGGDPVVALEAGDQVHVEEAVMARLYDASGNLLRTVMATGTSSRGVVTPAELCEQLGIDAADVFALNLDTGTVVTRDGQKHRLG